MAHESPRQESGEVCKERFAQLGGNLFLCCFDRGAILEYVLVQVVLTLSTDWADVRYLCEVQDAAECLVRKKLDWV